MLDANRIVQAMKAHGYRVDEGPDMLNIVYIEGVDLDGTPNGNQPNHWDDVRMLIQVVDGQAKIVGAWEATTEPGEYWTKNLMNPEGSFHVDIGQQTAWSLGSYHNREALIQARPVNGTRDNKRHYARDGKHVSGFFGVYHHAGYNYPKNNIGQSSAGCLVGRTVDGHLEFMKLLRTKDHRFSPTFVWTATVMPVSWINATAALPLPPMLVTVENGPSGRPLISALRNLFSKG